MSENAVTFFLAIAIGTFLGLMLALALIFLAGGPLDAAQAHYTHCLELQAPRDVCLERFLLPKED